VEKFMKKLLFYADLIIVASLITSCTQWFHRESKDDPTVIKGRVILQTSNMALISKLEHDRRYTVTTVDKETNVYLLSGPLVAGNEERIIKELQRNPTVEFAENDHVVSIDMIREPKDRKWFDLWGLKNIGQDSPDGTEGRKGADIDVMRAWDITTGSKDVVVAVIDTGIDHTHPDLKDNIWINRKEIPENGIDEDENGYPDDVRGWNFLTDKQEKLYHGQLGSPDPMDDNGHGTHCAGTVGAVGNNGIGVVGVNWKVQLMPIKILNKFGSGSLINMYRGILYAARNKVDIISASFGMSFKSELIEKAVQVTKENGILFVAAGGNDGKNNDFEENNHYPSDYDTDTILSVAATNPHDRLATFSNYGYEKCDIAAPGVGILSTIPVNKNPKDPYASYSGTSMATPHVAGAAALVLAANPDLKGKPLELKTRLMANVDKLPNLISRVGSGGRLNVYKAIKNEAQKPLNSFAWIEKPYELATPRRPEEKISTNYKIYQEGAEYIQIHLASSIIDDVFDIARIFDGNYNLITDVPNFKIDYWLPPIKGDTAYLKFGNALVKMVEGDDESKPFANFTSDGVVIDKIRYVKGGSDETM